MPSGQSVLIVGAGAFGVAAALELNRRGYPTTLLDPGPLPHEDASSTDISKAIRMDYGDDIFYVELAERAMARWEQWNATWEKPPFRREGFLVLSTTMMEPGSYEYESYHCLKERGQPVERLSSDCLPRLFQAFEPSRYEDGYLNRGGGWAPSGQVMAQLVRQARDEGVRLVEGRRFSRLLENGSKTSGILTTDGERHEADWVIMAAGAWTPVLLPHLGDVMRPVGQPVFHFRPEGNKDIYRPPHFCTWSADISRSGWYGFAENDGVLKVANHGPGVEVDVHAPLKVDQTYEERFREFLRTHLPTLGEAPFVRSRLCLYCDTFDGDFWIDHDPDREGLIVATGGSGHGFKFVTVLGEIIADVLERRPNNEAHRFRWRPVGPDTKERARYRGSS